MNPTFDRTTSRPFGVAQLMTGKKVDRGFISSQLIILTSSENGLKTSNGRWCFLDSIRLLARIGCQLLVVVPNGIGAFEAEIRALISNVWTAGTISVVEE